MKIHSKEIVHLPWSRLGNWKQELRGVRNCIAVLHADEAIKTGIGTADIEYIVENDITLAIENVRNTKYNNIGCTKDQVVRIIDGLPTSNFGLCYDTAHGRINNEDIFVWSDVADRIALFHFADSIGVKCGQPIGSGEVDFVRVFEFMREHYKNPIPIIYEIGG